MQDLLRLMLHGLLVVIKDVGYGVHAGHAVKHGLRPRPQPPAPPSPAPARKPLLPPPPAALRKNPGACAAQLVELP